MDLSSSLNIDDSFVNCEADTECTPSKDKIKDNVDKCVEEIANLKIQNKSLNQELGRLQAENGQLKEENKQQRFGLEFLKSNDKTVNFYTGIPNFATLKWLIDYAQPSLPVFHSVQDEDVVLIVTRFNVATSTISDVLNKSIPLIADKLKFLIHWPEKDDTVRTLPKVFKAKYKNARCIIDCTEVFIERPGNLTARAATWSNYKHHNTLKYLVAITPCGSISFVSKAFGGRTSDKVVTQRSGFLDLLEYNDLVLADRGFLIEEDILSRNCHLVMPSFTKGQTQLTQKQVETSRQLAHVRIHVERAIERIKNFRILSTTMQMNLVPHADSILTICAALCNLQPKLVK